MNIRNSYLEQGSERACSVYLVSLLTTMRSQATGAVSFTLFGKRMCRTAFARAFGISIHKLERCVLLSHEHSQPVPAAPLPPRATPKTDIVFAWLSRYFDDFTDSVPSQQGLKRVLFAPEPWRKVYQLLTHEYAADASNDPELCPSFSLFEAVRREQFPDVSRPRKNTLPRCSDCERFRVQRQSVAASERESLLKKQSDHAELHRQQRRDFDARVQMAKAAGDELVMAIDYTPPFYLPKIRLPGPPKVRFSLVAVHFSAVRLTVC